MVVFSSAVSNMLSRIGQQIEQRKLQNCATNGRSNNTNRSSRYPPTEFFNMRMQLVLIFAGVLLGTYTYCLLLERMGMRSVMQESEVVEMILLIHGGMKIHWHVKVAMKLGFFVVKDSYLDFALNQEEMS